MVDKNLEYVARKIREHYANQGVPEIPKTNVVSPLFPGQFNYCLDEVNLLEKYGDLVHIEDEHFQKIQPAIRLSDYHQQGVQGDHLGQFTIGTSRGFHSPTSKDGGDYRLAVQSLVSFFESLGLNKRKLSVTYFSGNYAKDVELSGKRDVLEKDLKVQVNKFLEKDELAVQTWTENGLDESRIIPNNTRDNFLTSAWYVTLAPWGFRNEVFYDMADGRKLDIGTVERLTLYPEVEMRRDSEGRLMPYVVDIHNWDVGANVDGFGLERVLLAIEGKQRIYDLNLFSPLKRLQVSNEQIESLRILHRVFTDASWYDLSRQRKDKIKTLMHQTLHLSPDEIKDVLEINTQIYAPLFPDLDKGVENTLKEIKEYKIRRK